MKEEIEKLLLQNGAALVGFTDVKGMYSKVDLSQPRSEDSETEMYDIPHYSRGISIVVAISPSIIAGIGERPTMDYYNAYHSENDKLDKLAVLCAEYIESLGYKAYPQTVTGTKEYGIFRTILPHKTVAINSGLGWIGKSALFVTEEFGSAVRLTSVLTDAPIDCENSAIEPKCGKCMICADACPGKAISGSLWSKEADRDDFFNAMACRLKAREIAAKMLDKKITLCGKCIEVCPYTRRYIERSM